MTAPDAVPLAAARRAAARAYENGQDNMAYGIGSLILELGAAGTSDSAIVVAVEDMIALRMIAGLDDAVEQLAEAEKP